VDLLFTGPGVWPFGKSVQDVCDSAVTAL